MDAYEIKEPKLTPWYLSDDRVPALGCIYLMARVTFSETATPTPKRAGSVEVQDDFKYHYITPNWSELRLSMY